MELPIIATGAATLFVVFAVLTAIALRRVVATNEVHIVQSSKKTISYGKDTGNGNTYYQWPVWLPIIGISRIILPVSIFQLELDSYEAYDKDKVPFEVDVVASFRISDSNMAAQRVSSFGELQKQLIFIVRGAVRTVLASHDIDEIMTKRDTFGEAFTKEVNDGLAQWGVVTVKNLELMDVRDSADNTVVHNIMAKKKSAISMQSRVEVANNAKVAEVAEVQATRDADLQRIEAKQQVELRNLDKNKLVLISQEQMSQSVQEQAKITAEKQMAVTAVNTVKQAEINRDAAIVEAEQNKKTVVLAAEATLERETNEAKAVELKGQARASAEKALQLAPVEAQIVLAKEIGANESYQGYLVTIRQVEAGQAVGIAQAAALQKAEIKVIANTGGDAASGLTSVGELFGAKGGLQVGSALEALANTDAGKALLNKFTSTKPKE